MLICPKGSKEENVHRTSEQLDLPKKRISPLPCGAKVRREAEHLPQHDRGKALRPQNDYLDTRHLRGGPYQISGLEARNRKRTTRTKYFGPLRSVFRGDGDTCFRESVSLGFALALAITSKKGNPRFHSQPDRPALGVIGIIHLGSLLITSKKGNP